MCEILEHLLNVLLFPLALQLGVTLLHQETGEDGGFESSGGIFYNYNKHKNNFLSTSKVTSVPLHTPCASSISTPKKSTIFGIKKEALPRMKRSNATPRPHLLYLSAGVVRSG